MKYTLNLTANIWEKLHVALREGEKIRIQGASPDSKFRIEFNDGTASPGVGDKPGLILDGLQEVSMSNPYLWVMSDRTMDVDVEVCPTAASGSISLPGGAATEAKQDAQITELQAITTAIQNNTIKTASKGSTTSASPTSKNIDSNVQALHTVLAEAAKTNGVPASGLSPIAGTFSTTGQSAHFTPIAGRDFNIQVLFSGAIGQVNLERSFDGINFYPITGSGVAIMRFTSDANEQWGDGEVGVKYRLNCTALSAGTVSYRISQ